jgi:hypothetical protein
MKRKAANAPSTSQRPVEKQPRLESASTSTPKRKEELAVHKPNLKRKSDAEIDHHGQTPRKVSRDSLATSVKNSAATRSNAPSTKAISTPLSSASSKKQPTTFNGTYARSNLSDSSSSDGQLTLTLRQKVELAAKFKKYYADYKKTYKRLEDGIEPSTAENLDLLYKKHHKVKEMKEQLRTGIVRQ